MAKPMWPSTINRLLGLLSSLTIMVTGFAESLQPPATYPAGIELVRIEAVVLDSRGQPVKGLSATDFTIVDGADTKPIVTFEAIDVRPDSPHSARGALPATNGLSSEPIVFAAEKNRFFLLFFDDVHVSSVSSQQLRPALLRFLNEEIRPGDWLTVISPLGRLKWTARNDREYQQLTAAIERLAGRLVRDPFRDGISDFEAMSLVEYGRSPRAGGPASAESTGAVSRGSRTSSSILAAPMVAEERYAVAQRRIRQTLRTLDEAILSLESIRGRKSLVLYSEGFIKAPYLPEYDRVVGRARRAQVAIYVIDPRGLRSGLAGAADHSDQPNPLLHLETESAGTTYLALATGGRVSISNDPTELFRQAMVESSAYYLIGFPASTQRGEHRIKLRVGREGVVVRAPDRYFVDESLAEPRRVSDARAHAEKSLADADDLPFTVSTHVARDARDSRPEVAFTLTFETSLSGAVQLAIELRPIATGRRLFLTADIHPPERQSGTVFSRRVALPVGVWQARVVARDARTGMLGSVLHTFEVSEPQQRR